MRSSHNLPEQVEIFAKLADLREVDYHNTLIIHSIVELLIQKGVITQAELQATTQRLDKQLDVSLRTQKATDRRKTLRAHLQKL